ncbi:hypothetical protein CHLRE_13g602300v5 [Chlamydomonas reinhardtii]|uniref:NOL1/NOP2/Sun domain family member 4 n=1 Tax=Chlamydomonas reinhardtii TaxID=3055 RepID=A0A2K3D1B4_CHLRE|nr:uncharacterized protein CHLRE_13g602300v5 [Chlamydomonas reinhardtii]PNW74307.1 hypothetical protein CHLRE_13g602300v5 [Chlamydomonas reinhardtii]
MKSSKTYAKGHRGKARLQDTSQELDKCFRKLYGPRWPALQAALLKPTQHAAVVNAFVGTPADSGDAASAAASASSSSITTASNAAGLVPLLSLGGVLSTLCRGPGTKPSSPYPPPPLDPGSALRCWYWMDLASVMPVLLLAPRRGHAALDMCAAPGGKACLIAQRLFGPGALVPAPPAPAPAVPVEAANAEQPGSIGRESGTGGKTPGGVSVSGSAAEAAPHQLPLPRLPLGPGKLVCNEPDRQRLARLQRVIEEYVPPHSRANIETLNYAGHTYWGRNQGATYDRVLVDAPCSSDRHVMQQAATTSRGVISASDWSLEGCKRIADEQLQLCLAAMRALRVGGRLVYSTCSIAALQNDDVVERLLRRCNAGGAVGAAGSAAAAAGGGGGGAAAARVLPALEVLQAELAEVLAVGVPAGRPGGGGAGAATGAGVAGTGQGADVAAAAEWVKVTGMEATRHGAICLPDRGGWGPIYVAVIEKTGEGVAAGGTGGGGLVAGMAALLRPQPESESEAEAEEEKEKGEGAGEAGVAEGNGAEAGQEAQP